MASKIETMASTRASPIPDLARTSQPVGTRGTAKGCNLRRFWASVVRAGEMQTLVWTQSRVVPVAITSTLPREWWR